jgi:hypothetical protein
VKEISATSTSGGGVFIYNNSKMYPAIRNRRMTLIKNKPLPCLTCDLQLFTIKIQLSQPKTGFFFLLGAKTY